MSETVTSKSAERRTGPRSRRSALRDGLIYPGQRWGRRIYVAQITRCLHHWTLGESPEQRRCIHSQCGVWLGEYVRERNAEMGIPAEILKDRKPIIDQLMVRT